LATVYTNLGSFNEPFFVKLNFVMYITAINLRVRKLKHSVPK